MCEEPDKLADFSSPPETVLQNALSAVCAEAPANMAEITNEQGTALIEDYSFTCCWKWKIEKAKT